MVTSIWKPLKGPLEDWPLAVCDVRSVDVQRDLAQATILHQDYMNHNCQVHYNEHQRWFYLRRQQVDELMLFRQFDSRLGPNNGETDDDVLLSSLMYLFRDSALFFLRFDRLRRRIAEGKH